jgi:uncharacterized protein (TIGR02145 family)
MKRITLVLLMTSIVATSIFAQAPKSFQYQAVVRDNAGSIIADQLVSFRIGVIQDSINGSLIYSETHSITTNQFGMAVLAIGRGSVETGIFENINWGTKPHFLKLELDETGGTNYQFMGTSELLSVPYSINSGSLTLTSPGGVNYEVSVDDSGNIITTCTPMPSIANAGADQDSVYYPATLAANIPQYGNGLWTIVNGTGGSFFDETNPTSEFYGTAGTSYTLRWTISNACGFTEDDMNISFKAGDIMVDAGPDQVDACSPTNLEGNTPTTGTGLWTIESGTGGTISEPSNPTSEFTGTAGNSYVLRWTITTAYESGFDDVNISFEAAPTIADAGTDQDDVVGTAMLSANTPTSGTGLWTIISGTGGFISEPTNPTSEFTGIPDGTYTLLWTISTVCDNSYDEVSINFAWICGLTLADERDGQTYSTVQIGAQCWMQENLNIGTRIDAGNDQTDNGSLEKYCYSNDTTYCDTYGGLYQWDEMMQYVTIEGAQGICPIGWHIPTDAEWCTLENEVDAGTVSCSETGWRGTDAGGNLKNTLNWQAPNTGATNSSLFTALPGGYRNQSGGFHVVGYNGYWWGSTEYSSSDTYCRSLYSIKAQVYRGNEAKAFGFSVRCLRD